MSTINISLPEKQVTFIDSLVTKYNFANRSELVRSVFRLLQVKPQVVEDSATFVLEPPKETSVKKIMTAFAKTNTYSPEFLEDLKEGLQKSKYFSE